MRPRPRHASIGSIAVFIAILLTVTFLAACQGHFDRDDADRHAQAKKGPAQVSVEKGQTVLTLDSPTQSRLGLEVATLTVTRTRAEVALPAVVLPVQDLVPLRNSYIATQTQLQKSRVEADVTRKEYARVKTLFEENQNVSEKTVQAADGTFRTSEADVRAAEQQVSLQESAVRQEWGSVVGKWAVEGSPELQRVLDQREMLVQMTVPSGATFVAPKNISVEIDGATRVEATLVSAFPRVDPRIQGRSFLYIAPARSGLIPGLNLVAHLSVGSPMQGVVVPTSAVIWSEGKAWVYQQTAAERFTRRAVLTDIAVERGFFVPGGFSPGDKLVVQGAQTLLSEELLLHGQSGGETDVD
jgi:hypothetical protein